MEERVWVQLPTIIKLKSDFFDEQKHIAVKEIAILDGPRHWILTWGIFLVYNILP